MRIINLLLILLCLHITALKADTVVVVGDSLSAGYGINVEEGWVNLLRQRLAAKGDHQVVNASISGDTTGGGLSRLPNILSTQQPDVVIIELGGNDGLRGYPIGTIEQNLRNMIELALQDNTKVVLVAMQLPPNYGTRYTSKFRAVYDQLAHEFNVDLVDNFIDDIGIDPSLMQGDGIHPTAEAQPLMLDNAWPTIANAMKIAAE